MVRRAIPLVVSLALALVVAAPPVAANASGERDTAVTRCGTGGMRLATVPETQEEAVYNDEIVVCDYGPTTSPRYGLSNSTPVVWAFYDSRNTTVVPTSSRITHQATGVTQIFWSFLIAKKIFGNAWVVAPGETVWLSSIDEVSFGVADDAINSAWLFYQRQAGLITKLGQVYGKRIATADSTSKARTFLWNCAAAGIKTGKLVTADDDQDPLDLAAGWVHSARADKDCASSFQKFAKSNRDVPASENTTAKWFTTSDLDAADTYLTRITKARNALVVLEDVITKLHPRV
jgi:hypothetical protein